MSNIREVAKLAGVSVATVSRAFSNPDIVSAKTRTKVAEAVEQAGYKPNLLARNFRARKSYAIVVLVPDISNPFFSRVIIGIQQAAKQRGYSVLLGNTLGRIDMEEEYAALVRTCQADGMIQLRAHYPFREDDTFACGFVPLVNACECFDRPDVPSVQLDNVSAASTATTHLLSLGHQRIGVVLGPRQSPLTRDRLKGYHEALEAIGIGPDPDLVVDGDFTMASGVEAAGTLMTLENPPTAIFCFNDEMAFGAMKRMRQIGLSVPRDISIAGFDDIAFSAFTDPTLTTIAQPAEEFGTTAVTMLLDMLQGEKRTKPHIQLPYELVVRNSTGPVPT